MKSIYNLSNNHVRLLELNKQTRFTDPVRCNHLVLVLCTAGELSFELNYTSYKLKKNGVLTVTPFDIIVLKDGSDDFLCTTLIMPASSFTPLLSDIKVSRYDYVKQKPVTNLNEDNGYLLILKRIIDILKITKEYLAEDEFDRIAEKQIAALLILQQNFFRNFEGEENLRGLVPRKKELFRNFIHKLIESHSLSREVLFYANELGVSSGYLNEICNEVSGHSAKAIIDSAVTARLKYEISYTSKSVQELADDYNFPSQSYFSRYFKRLTGMTPSEFRKDMQGK